MEISKEFVKLGRIFTAIEIHKEFAKLGRIFTAIENSKELQNWAGILLLLSISPKQDLNMLGHPFLRGRMLGLRTTPGLL